MYVKENNPLEKEKMMQDRKERTRVTPLRIQKRTGSSAQRKTKLTRR